MPEDRPFNVYREQLTSLYRGLALWEPSPVKNLYDKVSIGDVGYVHKGFFYRMLNVTLPWDHESNTKFELDYYEPLKSDPSTDIHEATLAKGDHTSRHVFGNENAGNVLAAAPDEWVIVLRLSRTTSIDLHLFAVLQVSRISAEAKVHFCFFLTTVNTKMLSAITCSGTTSEIM